MVAIPGCLDTCLSFLQFECLNLIKWNLGHAYMYLSNLFFLHGNRCRRKCEEFCAIFARTLVVLYNWNSDGLLNVPVSYKKYFFSFKLTIYKTIFEWAFSSSAWRYWVISKIRNHKLSTLHETDDVGIVHNAYSISHVGSF